MGIWDKVKKFRDEHPLLDMGAGFIPGVGEAQDVQDLTEGIKNKKYKQAALATAGLIIPGLSGAQIKAGSKLLTHSKDVKKFVEQMGSVNSRRALKPYLQQALESNNSEEARKIMNVVEKIAKGDIPEEALGQGTFVKLTPDILIQKFSQLPEKTQKLRIDRAKDNKITEYLSGYKGTTYKKGGYDEFLPNFRGSYGGTFTGDDLTQVLYYSGFGKAESMNRMKNLIEKLPNADAQEIANKALKKIDDIFDKYKRTDRSRFTYAQIDERLINPKTPEQLADKTELEECVLSLTQIFRNHNIDGVQELLTPAPKAYFSANFKYNGEPQPYGKIMNSAAENSPRLDEVFGNHSMSLKSVSIDDIAQLVGLDPGTKVTRGNRFLFTPKYHINPEHVIGPEAAIITNVRDINGGIGPAMTDIVMSPQKIFTPNYKNGNKIKLIERYGGQTPSIKLK